eukprot:1582184-Pleurochrysis_carterae.AAC.4
MPDSSSASRISAPDIAVELVRGYERTGNTRRGKIIESLVARASRWSGREICMRHLQVRFTDASFVCAQAHARGHESARTSEK